MAFLKEIDVAEAAHLLLISQRRVQQLAQQKWIERPYTIQGAIHGYLRFLSADKKTKTKEAGEDEVLKERARKLRLENDQKEGQLVPLPDAVATIEAIVGLIKADLSGIPPRVTDDIELRRRIENGMDAVLSSLADRCEQAVGDLQAGRDALAADAEDDADAVGEGEPEVSSVSGDTGAA